MYNIAIDGPAGAGKSTIAKRTAAELGYIYVDTGAMFRAMALFFLDCNIKGNDEKKISESCDGIDISISYDNGTQQVYLNGENVSSRIRSEEAGNMASAISVYPAVRNKLLELQRKLAASNNVVMDGRDIGTCVLPDANVKIYLTAGSHTRALRRCRELEEKGMHADVMKVEQDIIERDERDMHREIAPLTRAEDAVLIDSSEMSIEDVCKEIMQLVRKAGV